MRDTKPFIIFFLLLYNDEIIFHECTLIYLRDLRLLVLDEKSKL